MCQPDEKSNNYHWGVTTVSEQSMGTFTMPARQSEPEVTHCKCIIGTFYKGLCLVGTQQLDHLKLCWPTSQNKTFLYGTDNESAITVLWDFNLVAERKTQPIDVGQIFISHLKKTLKLIFVNFSLMCFFEHSEFKENNIATAEWKLLFVPWMEWRNQLPLSLLVPKQSRGCCQFLCKPEWK